VVVEHAGQELERGRPRPRAAEPQRGRRVINCWNDKCHWDFWRPWNAIPRAAEDGNPATEPDATCVPLIAAPYPEDPSGHLCLDGAHTRIVGMYFGDRVEGGHSITSVSAFLQPGNAAVRHFDSFSQVLDGILAARIWAGLHFRTRDLQGKTRGRSVARYAAAHYSRPLHRHHRVRQQLPCPRQAAGPGRLVDPEDLRSRTTRLRLGDASGRHGRTA